jgi:hypothetical protein
MPFNHYFYSLKPLSKKCCRNDSVFVVVLRSNENTVIADVVSSMADNQDLENRNISKGLV